MWKETTVSPELDERTGEILEYRLGPFKTRYDIPWSKKNVDDIISKFAHSDKDSIKYVIKLDSNDFPGNQGPSMHTSYTYDQFTTWSFDEILKYATRPSRKEETFLKHR